MRNKKWKLELLNMLKSCIQEKVQDLKEPLEQFLEEKNTDFHDQCLILFLVGEYTRISGDHFFYKEKKQKAFLQKISEWLMARFITVTCSENGKRRQRQFIR